MSRYELLVIWLLPLCWPLGIGAAAAFVTKSRLLFFAPVVAALFCMAVLPVPHVYASYSPEAELWHIWMGAIRMESAHMHFVALASALLVMLAMLMVGPSITALSAMWYRSPHEPDRT